MTMHTQTQPKQNPFQDAFASEDLNSIAALYYGIYDRVTDQDNALANIVVAPTAPDGSTDWGRACAQNLDSPSSDSGPADIAEARRWAVLLEHIDACNSETSLLLWVDSETGQPMIEQLTGPDADKDIAMRIIGRDIGAAPNDKTYEMGPLARSLEAVMNPTPKAPAAAPVAANDNSAQSVLKVIKPADWQGKPMPRREWYIDGVMPSRNVTLLSGDGGLGKSLFAIQIGVGGALGVETLGLMPKHGKCFYLGAEDEPDEFQRRIRDVLAHYHCDFEDLGDNFRLSAMAGEDATLALPDRNKTMRYTKVMEALVDEIIEYDPDLLVLDTSADLFGGEEINRVHVRQFVGMLRKIAISLDCAVLLLSHPSLTGMQSGTGTSGSTAWNNSVRSRLYLTGVNGDPDMRVLTSMKSNYGRTGDDIKMRWQDGLFVMDDGKPSQTAGLVNQRIDETFLALLSKLTKQGQNLSPNPSALYAPKVIAAHPEGKAFKKSDYGEAMQRLLGTDKVRIVEEGSPSKRRSRLIVSSEDYGPNA